MSNLPKSARKQKKRAFLFRWQQTRCYLCGRVMAWLAGGQPKPEDCTEDHATPRCSGVGRLNNTALAHFRCNANKGPRLATACERFFAQVAGEAFETWSRQRLPLDVVRAA